MKYPKISIVSPTIQAMMHGVAWFLLDGNRLTATYTDGTEESARVSNEIRDSIRAYWEYQVNDGPAAEEPSTFSLVSAVQSAREQSAQNTRTIDENKQSHVLPN